MCRYKIEPIQNRMNVINMDYVPISIYRSITINTNQPPPTPPTPMERLGMFILSLTDPKSNSIFLLPMVILFVVLPVILYILR